MSVVFNDPLVWAESSQWRAVFATPQIREKDSNSQLFSNFGSIDEETENLPYGDMETLIANVTTKFAMDVFMELRSDIQFDSGRVIKTSSSDHRSVPHAANAVQKTPTVTPLNSRRGARIIQAPQHIRERNA